MTPLAELVDEHPRLAVEVESAHFVTRDGTPYVVLHNCRWHTYLRLEPSEHELLPLMDGTHSVKALTVAYYQRHRVLAYPRVAGLVQLLREHRFLAEPQAESAPTHRRPTDPLLLRLGRAFLHAELPLHGVDGVLAAWYRAWGWLFFTRPAFVVGTLLGLLGPVLFLVELQRGRYSLLTTGGSYVTAFVLLQALNLAAVGVHELGHGLAVKHAGRTVHQAGLMLYYGFPAAYVDTTDVWMAPPRMRLLASFAGPWTGMVLGGLALLAAVLLPEGAAGALLFAWGFVFVLGTLLNFNPLLELDGYYILVDLAEKPMLRARAFAFVRGELWRRLRRGARLSSEELFFALFGVGSGVWSAAQIGLALLFWQRQVAPLVRAAWEGGGLPQRLGLLAILTLAVVPLALALWRLLGRAAAWIERLGRRAVERRAEHARLTQRLARRADVVGMPLFADLSPAQLDLLLARLESLRAEPGQAIVRQGEPGDRFYLVRAGEVEVEQDGRILARLGAGEAFGEIALIRDVPRTATVRAVAPTEVLALGAADFHELLEGQLGRAEALGHLSDRRLANDRRVRRRRAPAGT